MLYPPTGVTSRDTAHDTHTALQMRWGERLDTLFGPHVREECAERGAQAGIQFNFDVAGSSTVDSHRLILHAEQQGKGDKAAAVLARYYFEEGKPLGDHARLCAAADDAGVTGVAKLLNSDDLREEVLATHRRNVAAGIKTIPVVTLSTREGDKEETVVNFKSVEEYRAVLARMLRGR